MLFDLLSLQVSEMLRYRHVSSLMDDHDQIGTCLVHLSPDPTNVGSRTSDLMAQIRFPPTLTSHCLNVDFDDPDLLLHNWVLRGILNSHVPLTLICSRRIDDPRPSSI
jgi:hypothetical protein